MIGCTYLLVTYLWSTKRMRAAVLPPTCCRARRAVAGQARRGTVGSLATMAGDADVGNYDEDGGDEPETDDEVEDNNVE